MALKQDGTVVAWGDSDDGQTDVPAGLSGVVAIAGGGEHTVVLKSDGTVVAWGDSSSGQTTIPAGLSGVTAIAAGYFYTVALKSDGTVVAWGANGSGQTTIADTVKFEKNHTKFESNSNILTTSNIQFLILSEPTASYKSAFYDYSVSSGSNIRAGSLTTVFVGGSIQYYQTTTADIGNTSNLTMSVGINSGNIQLSSSVSTTTGWTVKAMARYI